MNLANGCFQANVQETNTPQTSTNSVCFLASTLSRICIYAKNQFLRKCKYGEAIITVFIIHTVPTVPRYTYRMMHETAAV